MNFWGVAFEFCSKNDEISRKMTQSYEFLWHFYVFFVCACVCLLLSWPNIQILGFSIIRLCNYLRTFVAQNTK